MKWLAIIISAVCLASCANKRTLTPPLPVAPPKAILVAPVASQVRESIAVADKTAAVLDVGAKEAGKAATAARIEAERLKNQKAANESELTKLWQDLQSVESRNLFLETQTSRLVANLSDARKTAETLQQHAAAKDAEAERLRDQHKQLSETASYYSEGLAAAYKSIQDERSRADKLEGEILLYRIALGIISTLALLYVAAKLVIRYFWK